MCHRTESNCQANANIEEQFPLSRKSVNERIIAKQCTPFGTVSTPYTVYAYEYSVALNRVNDTIEAILSSCIEWHWHSVIIFRHIVVIVWIDGTKMWPVRLHPVNGFQNTKCRLICWGFFGVTQIVRPSAKRMATWLRFRPLFLFAASSFDIFIYSTASFRSHLRLDLMAVNEWSHFVVHILIYIFFFDCRGPVFRSGNRWNKIGFSFRLVSFVRCACSTVVDAAAATVVMSDNLSYKQ